MFQSLGRDSVHSSPANRLLATGREIVSIPRSGFCSFKPDIRARRVPMQYGFNPSVGILFIQAAIISASNDISIGFQSLGRDSVHSSVAREFVRVGWVSFQSLGRDSVHSSQFDSFAEICNDAVSIPRSGFCSFKRPKFQRRVPAKLSFNPSVGILFIQAQHNTQHLIGH